MAVELGQVRISQRRLSSIRPSPENEDIYRPLTADDPDVQSLADSIRKRGVLEPLVVSQDGYIISGHRRHFAARLARLKTVPVRVAAVSRNGDRDAFVRLLREHNRQRNKSLDEKLREEIVSTDPDTAYGSLLSHRAERSRIGIQPMELRCRKRRPKISKAKRPLLKAIERALDDLKDYWPLSVRKLHYQVLNYPPLKHASKPASRYANDRASYKTLDELLTRARFEGIVPWESIDDPTRPVHICDVFRDPSPFIRQELEDLFNGYWRDLMQSQPNHVEIICEKNTIDSIIRGVAEDYTIPMTTGRGYCSLPPRLGIAQRFESSGKYKLVILALSDFDPDGENIAESFARSMRDDFGIINIHPVKVALTADQAEEFRLPPKMVAKATSSTYDRFVDRYGETVHELEAVSPSQLQNVLRDAIDSVIDVDAFNAEVEREKRDWQFLTGVRKTVMDAMKDLDLDAIRGDQ